jgi:quercetin dioxygenase-like cupin family protein
MAVLLRCSSLWEECQQTRARRSHEETAWQRPPDGDELLYLISAAVTVSLELPEGDRTVDLGAGDALIVPQGIWHRVTLRESGRLVHVTPGPNGDHRPLKGTAESLDGR